MPESTSINETPRTTPVSVSGIRKRFEGVDVLKGLDLRVQPGEFFTLLGPSGCGKSTLLRIIAGLESLDDGEVIIGSDDVTRWSPQRRGIGFVFQNYALFPHLTVEQNVAYALDVRKFDKGTKRQLVAEALELVELSHKAKRFSAHLSGGEQQRVAIARALVFRPSVLLLDEPLGSLDKRLRLHLGADLRRIQQEANVTALYVTHDQEEAFLLSDRIGVMREGALCQVGTPDEVYQQPLDLYVAKFLGDVNTFGGRLVQVSADSAVASVAGHDVPCRPGQEALAVDDEVLVLVRPEHLGIAREPGIRGAGRSVLGSGLVDSVVRMGSRHLVRVRIADTIAMVELDNERSLPAVGSKVEVSFPSADGFVLSTGTHESRGNEVRRGRPVDTAGRGNPS